MGVIEFAKSVGRKLGIEDDTPPAQSPRGTNAQVRKAAALTMSIRQLGWPADDLGTHVEDDQVILAGRSTAKKCAK